VPVWSGMAVASTPMGVRRRAYQAMRRSTTGFGLTGASPPPRWRSMATF